MQEDVGGLMLRGSRIGKSLTQKKLADELGIEQQNISGMECGTRTISRKVARKLAEYFEVDYRCFL